MKLPISKCLVVSAGTLVMGAANAALTVYADANGDTIHDAALNAAPGSTFTVSLYALDDGLHGGLASYAVEIGLTPTLKILGADATAQLSNITSGAHWDLPESKSVSPTIEVIDGSLFSSFSGTVHLFDMTLDTPAAPGAYTISIKNVEPDSTFDGFVGFDGYVYDPTILFETTVVTAVPVPAALSLFASALAGLAWGARRRQAQRAPS